MNFKLPILSILCLCYTGLFAQQKNIALNKEVTASSEDIKFPAKNIVDGKISRTSKWQASTNKAPHILEINLNKYYNIHELRIHSGIMDQEKKPNEMTQAAGFWSVKNFKMQYWDDANWTDFPKSEIHENRLTNVVMKFSPAITTFKIRLVCDDGEAISVMEIEAFGEVSPNMPAPPTIASSVKKRQQITKPQTAGITVSNTVTGKTLQFVGYNQGYYMPGSNVSGWMEYSNVNSVRLWATMNAFVPEKSVQVDENLTSVEEFDRRKNELRKNPEHNKFIKWDELTPLYNLPDSSSTNAMVYNYALHELKRLGIAVVLQMGSTDFKNNWENKWKQWQRYYALAYHSAKTGDVAMFAMTNEPNHKNAGPMKLDDWIMGMQITSDAVHCAVEDVNKAYGKKLQPKFVGPVTAGQNTDWWAAVAKAIRTDYHGKKVDKDLLEIFSTHSYNSPAAGYVSRVNNIRKIIVDNHPEHQPLPIVYTEIGRWMNAYLIDKEETMDSPSLFTEWAGIYSNNMNNQAYGMWAFKFANTASGTYPRGIKSGHHFIWQGKRIVEDAYTNLALNKAVKTSSSNNQALVVTDGDKSNASAWTSDASDTEKWIEIDLGTSKALGSSVIYTGSAGGVYTSTDRIKNFKLQYLSDGNWKDIPGTEEKNCRYAQVFTVFKEPVTAQKIRFLSKDKGALKVREIKVFAKDDGPSDKPDYNVSGIQRTGEVVRLFAKGFKDQRNLLQTKATVNDPDLDTYTSYDDKTGNYYMWLVQRGGFDYNLSVNLSALNIAAGAPVTAETVNPANYGEVTTVLSLPPSKIFNFKLLPQSVVLLTIPSARVSKTTLFPVADAYVAGAKEASLNFAKEKSLKVQLDAAKPENNKVSFIRFNLPGNTGNLKKVILAVDGSVNKGQEPFRLHVYGIPAVVWMQEKLNWKNAPLLDTHEALIDSIGTKAFVAGELAFDQKNRYHYLDVTEMVRKHAKDHLTFVFVRETRQLGDDEDEGRTVSISSMENVSKPKLELWRSSQ